MAAVAAEVGTRAAQKLDNVIERLGIGRFHYLAAMVCGLANAADAVELLCISFILPELPQAVSNQEKSALNAAVFLGMLVGGVVAGVASDRLGRKPMLLSSLAVNAAFGLLSVLSPSWPWLAACRVVAGMGVGGSIPGVFGLFTEYLPVQSRGFFISIVAWWWMIGQVFTAGSAWILIGELQLPWQMFAAVCSAPAAVSCVCIALLLPESPRYLLQRGQYSQAADSMAYISRVCGRPAWASIEAKELWLADLQAGADGVPLESTANAVESGRGPMMTTRSSVCLRCREAGQLVRNIAADIQSQLRLFWSPQLRKTSGLLSSVWFCLSFGWYGLLLWIPTLFKAENLELDSYEDSFFVAAANLPGNIVAAILMDRIGRKHLLAGSLVGACASAVLFAFANTRAIVILAACLLNAISVGSWNSLDCLSSESFPTTLRTSSMGFLSAGGRVGSIAGQFVFGALIDVSIPLTLCSAATVLLIGAACSWMLPKETAGQQLTESLSFDPEVRSISQAKLENAPLVSKAGGMCDPIDLGLLREPAGLSP